MKFPSRKSLLCGSSAVALNAVLAAAAILVPGQAYAACTTVSTDTTISNSATSCITWTGGNISITGSGFVVSSTHAGITNSGNTVGNLTNSGTLGGDGEVGISNTGTIGSITNTDMMNDIFDTGNIGVIANSGSISSIFTNHSIGTISNTGIISSTSGGIVNFGTVGTITNSGTISGIHFGIHNTGTISSLTNSGLIRGASAISSTGTILSALSNSGTIAGSINVAQALTITGGSAGTLGTLTGYNGTIATITTNNNNLTFDANAYQQLNDAMNVGTGTVNNSGTLSLSTIVSIAGNFAQASGNLIVGGSAGLSVSGTALVTGGTITDSLSATGNYLVTDAATTIIQGSAGSSYTGLAVAGTPSGLAVNLSGISNGLVASYANDYIGGTLASLTNSGTISGPHTAIAVAATASIGTLTNSGSIGAVFGILTQSGSSIGTIANTGMFNGIIFAQGNIGLISNTNTITGNQAISNGGSIGSISNAGALAGAYTGISNSGIISVVTNTGTISGGNGINSYGTISTLNNSNLITGNTGINNDLLISTIINSGTITGSIGIFNNTLFLGTIFNTGTISGSSIGIYNDTGYGRTGSITSISNSGLISGPAAINSTTGTILSAISNAGTIAGSISVNQALTITGGSSGTLGTLTGYNGTIATITTNNYNLTFDANAHQLLNEAINVASATVTNSGVLQVNTAQSITGNYAQGSGGSLIIGAASSSSYGELVVSGAAVMTNDIISITAVSGSLTNGEVFTIAQASTIGTNYSGITASAGAGYTASVSSSIVGGFDDLIISLATIVSCQTVSSNTTISSSIACVTWNGANLSIAGAGTVSGKTTAILNSTHTVGTLTNSGSISGSVYGLSNGGTIASIGNSGAINGNTAGIYNTGTIGTITNSGTISGELALYNSSGSIGSITNTGIITGTVGVYNTETISVISNSELIGGNHQGILNGGSIGSISNSGTISGGYSAIGNNGTIGTITNNGTIINTGGAVINVQQFASIGVINNIGTISGGSGIVNSDLGNIGTIINSGTISGSSVGIINYTNITYGRTGTISVISNSGLIEGPVAINSMGSILSALSNAGTIAGSITANQALTITGGSTGTLGTLTGYNGTIGTITTNGHNLTFDTNAHQLLNEAINVTAATVTNSGALQVNTAQSITGNYAQGSGGELIIGATSSSSYGELVVSGAATLANTSISIIATSGSLSAGEAFTIMQATTAGTSYSSIVATAAGFTAEVYSIFSGGNDDLVVALLSSTPGFYNNINLASLTNIVGHTLSGTTGVLNGSSGTIGTISNSGVITGTVDGINNTGTIGSIVNAGVISGGIISTGTITSAISNAGTISGNINVNQALTFTGGSPGTVGTLTGGTITATGVIFNSGADQQLSDAINVGSGTVTNSGGILSLTSVVSITGNYAQASGNLIISGVGELSVSGTASVTGGTITDSLSATGNYLTTDAATTIIQGGAGSSYAGITLAGVPTGLAASLSTVGNALEVSYGNDYIGGNLANLTNSGTISGAAAALYVAATGSLGTLTNNGLLHGSTYGIINNSGTINAITNSNSITGGTYGIRNDGVLGAVTNTGVIVGTTDAIYNDGSIGTINNGGSLNPASGIFALVNHGAIGTIINSGLLNGVDGIVNSGGGASIGTINNSGTITASFAAIETGSSIGRIINSGLVAGPSAIASTGVGANGIAAALSNSGTIEGKIAVDQALVITGGNVVTLGTLTGYNGTIGTIATTNNNLTFDSNAFQLLDDNINVGASNTVFNNGLIRVNTTHSITGNYTQGAGGTLVIGVTDPTHYGQLIVSGAATMTNGQVLIAPTSGALSSGETFTIVQAATAGTSYSGVVTTANGFTVTTSSITSGGNEDLIISLTVGAGGGVGGGTGNYAQIGQQTGGSNGAAVGAVLDQLQNNVANGSDTNFAPVLAALNTIGVQQGVAAEGAAIKQLAPGQLSAGVMGNNFTALQSMTVIGQHQQNIRGAGTGSRGRSSGSEYTSGALWMQVDGGFANSTTAGAGYHQSYYGMTFGVDDKITRNLTLGGAFSWAHNNAQGGNDLSGDSVAASTPELMGYGTYRLGRAYIDGMLGVGYNMFTQSRSIGFLNSVASSKYGGMQYMGNVETGYDFAVTPRTTMTPLIGFNAVRTDTNGYTENGAEAADTAVGRQIIDSYTTSLGGRVSTAVPTALGKLLPDAKLAWAHDLNGSPISSNATLSGVNFATSTPRAAQDGAEVALGATLQHTDALSVRAEYDGDLRADYQSHTGLLKGEWKF